jgi:hypothetical protein
MEFVSKRKIVNNKLFLISILFCFGCGSSCPQTIDGGVNDDASDLSDASIIVDSSVPIDSHEIDASSPVDSSIRNFAIHISGGTTINSEESIPSTISVGRPYSVSFDLLSDDLDLSQTISAVFRSQNFCVIIRTHDHQVFEIAWGHPEAGGGVSFPFGDYGADIPGTGWHHYVAEYFPYDTADIFDDEIKISIDGVGEWRSPYILPSTTVVDNIVSNFVGTIDNLTIQNLDGEILNRWEFNEGSGDIFGPIIGRTNLFADGPNYSWIERN